MKVKDLKTGNVFIETEGLLYARCQAIEDAHHVDDPAAGKVGWECKTVVIESNYSGAPKGKVQTYFESSEHNFSLDLQGV